MTDEQQVLEDELERRREYAQYLAELNAIAETHQSIGWALICKYLDGIAVSAYDALKACKSSNNTVMAGFAREFTRKKEIVDSVKGFVADKFNEREKIRKEELEAAERERLIQQLGEQSEYSSNNA